MEKQLDELENLIGYHFNDQGLLAHAMTHSSSANEKHLGKLGSNERLEFLGDAVLELVSSDYLYSKYPKIPEGELTKKRASMVCEPSLAFCARRFDLPRFILLGKGEEMTGGRKRDSIVSDATEALIGAIYLDGGFERAASFIRSFILQVAAILIMPLLWGLDGIWYAVLVVEVLSLLVAVWFLVKKKDKYHYA